MPVLDSTQVDHRSDDAAAASQPTCMRVGELTLDPVNRDVVFRGRAVDLTGAEFSMLELLMESAGRPVGKERFVERALGRRYIPHDRSVDVHIGNLRRKLAAGHSYDALIKTIRGRGYLLCGHLCIDSASPRSRPDTRNVVPLDSACLHCGQRR